MRVTCPACQEVVSRDAWICPFCEFIIDPSVLEESARAPDDDAAWSSPGEVSEAMILGDVNIDPDDFQVLAGAGAGGDGRTTTFLFYTSGATSRVLRLDVVPTRSQQGPIAKLPTTPYEDFILAWIDGKRSVREIQRASGLTPQEVTITLLTLLDKKIIGIDVQQSAVEGESSEDLPVARPRPRDQDRRGKSVPPALPPPDEDDDSKPVVPSDLDEQDREDTTEFAPELPTTPRPELQPKTERPATPSFEPREPPRLATPAAALEAPRPSDPTPPPRAVVGDLKVDASRAEPAAAGKPGPASLPAPIQRASDAKVPETPLPTLDPAFLIEVPRPPERTVVPLEPERRQPGSLPRRPIQERLRRGTESDPPQDAAPRVPSIEPPAKAPKKESAAAPPPTSVPPEPPARPSRGQSKPPLPPSEPVDGIRMAKASKLFAEALRDKADGNLVSARMNMKLALTFDPTNPLYIEAHEDLVKLAPTGAAAYSKGKELHDRATDAERAGKVDEAIRCLEQGIEMIRDPSFHNRLGVLLATKRREYIRAQELIETALELSPGNTTYQHNLGKVLQMAAARDVSNRDAPQEKKRGLLDFLGRRK